MNVTLPQHSFLHSRDLDLNQFIVDNLQTTELFNAQCGKATDALAEFLKKECGLSFAEVVKVSRKVGGDT